MAEDQRRRVLAELSTCKNVLEHIRTNTQNVVKAASNSSWELRELRTGGTAKDSGEVDAQKGSLLATLGVLGENQMSATIEQLGKLAADLRDAIEKGTEPSKSLKRKREEAEYAELLRQKEELQKEHERTKKYPITHPITQQQLFLTIDEQRKMFADLASAKPEDFAGGHMHGTLSYWRFLKWKPKHGAIWFPTRSACSNRLSCCTFKFASVEASTSASPLKRD